MRCPEDHHTARRYRSRLQGMGKGMTTRVWAHWKQRPRIVRDRRYG